MLEMIQVKTRNRADQIDLRYLAVLACEFHAFARFLEQQEGQMNKSPPGVNDVVDEQTFRTEPHMRLCRWRRGLRFARKWTQ